MYETFSKVEQLITEVLESPLIKREPLGIRLILVLEEKQKVVRELLAYLSQEELPEYAAMVEWLKIIYRNDETEKLHFKAWKRVSLQNNYGEWEEN